MNRDRFQQLKQKLIEEKDFSKIWSFYMDHFTDAPMFVEMGKPAQNKQLNAIVLKTCQEMFGKSAKVNSPIVISIAKYNFFHGPLQVGGRMGGMMYFDDIETGMIAVSAQFPPTAEVKYSRFSTQLRISATDPNDRN
jgi:hypothetical protein